jgi:hypothetical protein
MSLFERLSSNETETFLQPLHPLTSRQRLMRTEHIVWEMWQHRVVGGVASAPRREPPPRPSRFFVFVGLFPSQCGVLSTLEETVYVTTDFN